MVLTVAFEENEQILFKHKASLKGNKGELLVTTVRIIIIPENESDTLKQYSWANVSNIKYSPQNDAKGRAMMLLKTVMKGEESAVIQLLGPKKDDNFSELERLKGIVTLIRKGKVSTSSNIQNKKNNQSNEVVNARKRILEADKSLAKQYQELVIVGKIIEEEEFWSSHENVLLEEIAGLNTSNMLKGNKNSVLSDVMEKDSNGVIKINLTVEKRQAIFMLYPAVQKAFETEVPFRMSETEFWTAYFQSEYFNNKLVTNEKGLTVSKEDSIFAKYEIMPNADAQKNRFRGSFAGGIEKLSGKVDSEMDLTSTYGDYKYIEKFDNETSETAGQGLTGLAQRYNKNSAIAVGNEGENKEKNVQNKRKSSEYNESISDSLKMKELLNDEKPKFNLIQIKSTENSNNDMEIQTKSKNPKEDLKESSSSRINHTLDILERNVDDENIRKDFLLSLFPEENRSKKFFDLEFNKTQVRKAKKPRIDDMKTFDTLGDNRTSTENENESNKKIDENINCLPEQFLQEMYETFTEVTEWLRHFYAIMGRTGDLAPKVGNQSAKKAEAILQRLTEETVPTLERHKRKLNLSARSSQSGKIEPLFKIVGSSSEVVKPVRSESNNIDDKKDPEAAVAVISGILLIIQRAKLTWSIFTSSEK